MTYLRIPIMVVAVLFFSLVLSCGCTPYSSNHVVINRGFLYDIEKEFGEEARSGKSRSVVYNRIWESNYYELIYLTTKGDRKAIDVSISLIGQKGDPACLYEEIELLTKPTFESDPDYFWEALERKANEVQARTLNVFDFHKPIDWDMEGYLAKHPEIKKLYEDRYRVR
jgi:hypothetical protein